MIAVPPAATIAPTRIPSPWGTVLDPEYWMSTRANPINPPATPPITMLMKAMARARGEGRADRGRPMLWRRSDTSGET